MSATARDAAFAWLRVGWSALEAAADCAAAAPLESLAEYEQKRRELERELREAAYELRIAEIIHKALARERGLEEEEAA